MHAKVQNYLSFSQSGVRVLSPSTKNFSRTFRPLNAHKNSDILYIESNLLPNIIDLLFTDQRKSFLLCSREHTKMFSSSPGASEHWHWL